MRDWILGLLVFSSCTASACEIERAQFIGRVKNHYDVLTSETSSECFYQIEWTQFSPNVECPLTPGEVTGVEFRDSPCALQNGDSVSGVMAKSGNSIYIE